MHAVVRPIVTIGVALVGTAVIVVNPIVAPPRDVAIPAKQSLASVQRDLYMLDPTYLQALAAAGPQPLDRVEFVPRLVDTLTTDAAPVSREALAAAFAFGGATVSARTRASVPDMPAEVGPSADSFIGSAQVTQQTLAFQWMLDQLLVDVNDVGAKIVAAAFAAGAVDAAMDALIADDIESSDELAAALHDAVSAAIAPLNPSALAIDAIQTTINGRVAEVASTAAAAPEGDAEVQNESDAPGVDQQAAATAESGTAEAEAGATAESGTAEAEAGATAGSGTAEAEAGAAKAEDDAPVEEGGTSETTASADANGTIEEDTTANGGSDLTDGNKVEPGISATKKPSADAAKDRLAKMVDGFNTAIEKFRDRFRKMAEQGTGNESGAADTANSSGSGAPGSGG